jgi:hypothetical protein
MMRTGRAKALRSGRRRVLACKVACRSLVRPMNGGKVLGVPRNCGPMIDDLDGLLKGAIGCSRNLLLVCSQAQLRFKRFNQLFIRSV